MAGVIISGMTIPTVPKILCTELSLDGLGVTTNAIGDYSLGANFDLAPAAGEIFMVGRFLVQIGDTGPLSADEYGNHGVLTNGVLVQKVLDTGAYNIFSSAVKKNADWDKFSYDTEPDTFGAGENFLHVRHSFTKYGSTSIDASNGGILLVGDRGERFRMALSDDFTGVTSHYFVAEYQVLTLDQVAGN
jgi:hypothetical protein